ncbi:MAG TPA: hypothetical protein VFL29_09310 [Candidatus Dormibacteraeota bacterium]|nr:hypothetical protein [Candidatus Dormibacteraeota bacterium]
MSPRLARTFQVAVMVSVVAGAALALTPSHAGAVTRLWLLALALIASVAAAGLVATAPQNSWRPPRFWRRRRAPVIEVPADLESLQLAVQLAMSSEFDRHYRLRPVMVDIAAGLLARRRGVDLFFDRERASALLGPELWELVRPERPEPPGRGRRELDGAALARMVDALEGLSRD